MGSEMCIRDSIDSWRRALRAARRDGVALPNNFKAHHLRATFASLVLAAGADASWVRRYMGHVDGVLERHYQALTLEAMCTHVVRFVPEIWQLDNRSESVNACLA